VSDPLRLIRLSPDWVKIDLALTARVGDDPSTVRLLEFLIAWSEKAEVRLIAEGVARREQLERLASLGIRYVQGFFLAPPEPSWRTGIDLPLRSARIRLGRRSLGLAHPYPLREEDLTLIARKAPLLAAVVPRAVEAALAHLEHIPALPRGNVAEFRTALCRHFARILQGELDESDVLLLERLAEESLAQGLELGWHVLLHRHILEAVSSQALDLPEATLGALDALLTWHLSALAALIAEHLSRDEETGLLTRNLFLLRGKALVAELKEAWLVVLLRVSTPRHESLPAVIRLVGALASGGGLGGRIGEREFALLVPFRRELLPTLRRAVHEARRRLSPARLDVGLALSRRDGDDFVALYLRAYQRLAGRHHAP